MRLTVRNMVCDRCKAAVERVFTEQGLPIVQLELGHVELRDTLVPARLAQLDEALEKAGFALVQDPDAQLITAIKAAIVALVHREDEQGARTKLAPYLSDKLHRDYSGLSALFSTVEGITIEHYFLQQRIERVKELIQYGELTISEIAHRTGFSSVAHLSTQFKKLTGMTPTEFRERGGRRALDAV